MALKKITATDFKEAVDALTPYGEGQVVWLKKLGRTDGGTGLYLVVGWTRELGYSPEEIEASGFVGDNDDYLAYKIGYFNYKPGIRYLLQDFDDFRMPYNLKDDKSHGIYAGDVWATDSYLPNEPAAWSRIADELTKDAQGIWDTWGENGELDLMESKKSESAKGSMRRKQESLSKKNEGFMEDLPYDAPVAIDALCAEIMSHTEEFTIEDAAVAEMCGKWYIRNYAGGPTAAHNEEEWVEEVTVGLSGSPVDGSPFGAAEAEEYAHRVYKEELAEE